MARTSPSITQAEEALGRVGGVLWSLKELGIDLTKIPEAWQKSQTQIRQRLDSVAPLMADAISEMHPFAPDVFTCLEEGGIPYFLRKPHLINNIEVGRGFDESMRVIALAGVCGVPKELPMPLSEEQEEKYLKKIKQKLVALQLQFDNGQLDKNKFNSLLDTAVDDEFQDLFADLKSAVNVYAKKISCEIDKVLVGSGIVAWADNFARPKPKKKEKGAKARAKAFLQRHGVL